MQNTQELLAVQFGPLMTSEEVARVLKFPTVPALRAALRRKRLSLTPVDVPGRKQHLFATEEVAGCVDRWKRKPPDPDDQADDSGEEAAM